MFRTDSYGWTGTILTVDLTKRKVIREPLRRDMVEKFLGGDGLGAKLLFDRMPANTDPLAPENPFILSTGPLTGTLCPSSGRLSVVFKSPLSGLIALSNSGGYLAPEIKWAGYDAIVMTGKADRPVWVWIDNDTVEIRDADHLWGKDTWETIEAIFKEVNDDSISTMVIGPAGENLVKSALALVNTVRAPGKGGSGAVMGSKNLKGIGVRGSKGIKIFDPDTFEQVCESMHRKIKESPSYEEFSRHGTRSIYAFIEGVHGALPTNNFQDGTFAGGQKKLSAQTFEEELSVKTNMSCFGCPIQCSNFLEVKTGKYKGVKIEGLEFYAQFCFGSNLGVADWPFIAKCHEMCTKLGLQYEVAHLMAWLAELYEKGVVTSEDVDGLDLSWGNEEGFLALLGKIARREGIGDILAGNFETAAQRIGKESGKYQSIITRFFTTEDPRARMDIALSHLISNRGGDHNKATPYFNWWAPPEYTQMLIPGAPKAAADPYTEEGKPELIAFAENVHAIIDASGVCVYATFLAGQGIDLEDFASLITSATGTKYNKDKLLEAGRRITALERCFNIREGFDRTLYQMSEKFYKTATKTGVQKGVKADKKVVDKMVDDFLTLKGFDPETGYPTEIELKKLGLEDVADQLDKMGRLSKKDLAKDAAKGR